MARKSQQEKDSKSKAQDKPKPTARKRHTPNKADEDSGRILDETTKRDIAGIIFIIFAIVLMILAVMPEDSALVSGATSRFLHLTFGVGAYMLPVFLLAIGFTFLYRSQKQRMPVRAAIGLSILFIALLGFIALFSPISVLGQNDLSLLFLSSTLVSFGGYIGAAIAWGGIALFGHIVTGVLLVGAMIVGIVIVGFSVSKLVESIRKKKQELIERRKSQSLEERPSFFQARVRRAPDQAQIAINTHDSSQQDPSINNQYDDMDLVNTDGQTRPLMRLQPTSTDARRRLGTNRGYESVKPADIGDDEFRLSRPYRYDSYNATYNESYDDLPDDPYSDFNSFNDEDYQLDHRTIPVRTNRSEYNLVELAERDVYAEDSTGGAHNLGGFSLPIIGRAAQSERIVPLHDKTNWVESRPLTDNRDFQSFDFEDAKFDDHFESDDYEFDDYESDDYRELNDDMSAAPFDFNPATDISSTPKPKGHYVHIDPELLVGDTFTSKDTTPADIKQESPDKQASSLAGTDIETSKELKPHKEKPVSKQKEKTVSKPNTKKLKQYREERNGFKLPSFDLLASNKSKSGSSATDVELSNTAQRLQQTIADFGINVNVVGWVAGPTVTLFKIDLPSGVRVSRITALNDDIALALAAPGVRIFAPIPGTNHVGIEVPNDTRQTVFLKDVLKDAKDGPLEIAIGKDVEGNSIVSDLAKMPHLLIGGTTGSGKSVSINAMIMSILMRATPDEVRFIMVDPKRVEFSPYNGIPHLYVPVVTEPKEAASALSWGVAEMERRLKVLSKIGARNIQQYNARVDAGEVDEDGCELERMPYIVIIIDELADLMMNVGKEVEASISRIAQLARAAGIHLIVATQRPSTNVVTGLIKANITNRIAFNVASGIDSRVILDTPGAENLIGLGDLLLSKPEIPKPQRIQGCYVSEAEINAVVNAIKDQAVPEYHDEILKTNVFSIGDTNPHGGSSSADDPLVWEAAEIVVSSGLGSTSSIQRRLKVGYARAGRIMDQLEEKGIVGSQNGSKPREVLVDEMELETLKAFEAQDIA